MNNFIRGKIFDTLLLFAFALISLAILSSGEGAAQLARAQQKITIIAPLSDEKILQDLQGISENVYNALVTAIQNSITDGVLDQGTFSLISWDEKDGWALGTVGVNGGESLIDNTFLVVARQENNNWSALTQFDSQFENWLYNSPETFLDRSAIPLLSQGVKQGEIGIQGIPINLRFPWKDGQEWRLGSKGIHGAAKEALDFIPRSTIPITDRKVVAAADGVVYRRCSLSTTQQDYLVIRHYDNSAGYATEYFHMARSSVSLGVGSTVKQGDVIGILLNFSGSIDEDPCGHANAPHIHFGVGTINASNILVRTSIVGTVIEGWIVDSNSCLTKGAESGCIGDYFSSASGVDVALIIDATGSMVSNDSRGMRKDAAKAFIATAAEQPGNKIAVVSFNSRAHHLAALRTIQSQADRDALIATVDQVVSSGSTNINAGLNGGFAELVSDTTTNKKAAVLLTDGRHNSSAYNPQSHRQYKDKGWPVYTVGLGNADMVLLKQIATETGGQCVNECKPLDNPDDLQAVYFEILKQIGGGSIIHSASTLMTQGSSEQLAVSIPTNQPSATFFVAWPGSEVSTSLTSPSGRQIGPATTDPDIYHATGLTYEIYTVQYPEAGQWAMDLYGTSLPPGGEMVDVRVAVQSPGLTTVHLPIIVKSAGGPAPTPTLFGTVTDNGTPVVGTEILLRYYDGSDWSTYDATSTDSTGNYQFTKLPKLGPNQSFYVRWSNTAANPNRLWTWSCWAIISPPTTDPNAYRCNFDIDDVGQISPGHGATVALPYTFVWDKRSIATDDYELTLADMNDYTPWWWTESLGYVDRHTLNGLPAGLVPGQQYGWWMWAYGPDGFGTSYYYHNITFSNSGTTVAVEPVPMPDQMTNKNIEEFPPPQSR